MSVATYTNSGSKAATPAKLDKKIFGLEVANHELIKQAYLTYLSNGRKSHAKAKSRGDVSGGGQKPWRQKGTGRARFGSSRNPIWRGGGAAFGPTGIENYSKKLNKQAKQLALKQALSISAHEERIAIIENFSPADGRSKAASALLKKLGAERNTLIVLDKIDPKALLAVRNIQGVEIVKSTSLSTYHAVNADYLIFTKEALNTLSERLVGPTANTPTKVAGEQG